MTDLESLSGIFLKKGIIMSNKNLEELARQIIEAVGGKENVSFFTLCLTRLRFNLKDASKVDIEKAKGLDGVVDAQWIGDQFQVIIGAKVRKVYETIIKQTGINGEIEAEEPKGKFDFSLKSLGSKIIGYISGSVVAIIPILQVAGLALAFKTILGPDILNALPADNGIMIFLQMINTVGFYFVPIALGYAAAKRLNLDPIFGLLMGMLLVAPDFVNMVAAGQPVSLFGINVPLLTYTQTVFPVLLCMPVVKLLNWLCRRYLPDIIESAFTSSITFFIATPLAFLFIAPLGNLFAQGFAFVLNWVTSNLGFIGGGLIGGLWLIVVMTGTHIVLMPGMMAQLTVQGFENTIMPAMGASYYALLGVELAALIKIKNQKERGNIISYMTSDLIGNVSEPSLYGICMKYKNALLGLFVGGFVGGALANILGLCTYGIVPSIHVADMIFNLGAIGGPDPTLNCVLTFVRGFAALVVSFIFCYMFAFKKTVSGEDVED